MSNKQSEEDLRLQLQRQNLSPSDHDFWAKVWHTPMWKQGEVSKPFEGNLAYAVENSGVSLEQFASQTALVPLCGDTEALDFLSSHFQRVIGVEFNDSVVNSVRDRFVRNGFVVASDSSNDDESERVIVLEKNGKQVVLQRRDFFLPSRIEPGSVHFVYDRASLVAIEPSRRDEYAALMKASCAPGAVYFLITIERANDPLRGPPFHVPKEVVDTVLASRFSLQHFRVDPAKRIDRMVELAWQNKHYVLRNDA
ncbi:MAG: hypothetical protein MHM6MM_008375 [Cercozoa sp. M6MM]